MNLKYLLCVMISYTEWVEKCILEGGIIPFVSQYMWNRHFLLAGYLGNGEMLKLYVSVRYMSVNKRSCDDCDEICFLAAFPHGSR